MKGYAFTFLTSLVSLQFSSVTTALSMGALTSSSGSANTVSHATAGAANGTTSLWNPNITSLLYPNCTADANANWCGLVFGFTATSSDQTALFNISVTDSSCKEVGRKDNLAANSTTELSTSIGDWIFNISNGDGIEMTYNKKEIGNMSIFGNQIGIEAFNWTNDGISGILYGAYQNCTPAAKAKSVGTQQQPGSTAALVLAAVSLLFLAAM